MSEHPPFSVLLARDRDDLLTELGQVGFEITPRDALARGAAVYETMRSSLRTAICGDEGIRDVARDGNRTLEIAAALHDLLVPLTHGAPAATLAVLLVKDGLSSFCAKDWAA